MRPIIEVAHDLIRAGEILLLYENQISKKTCNNCVGRKDGCEYSPGWGKPVRWNCPFWKPMIIEGNGPEHDEFRANKVWED